MKKIPDLIALKVSMFYFFLEVKKVIKIPTPNPITVNAGIAKGNSFTKSKPIPIPINKNAGTGHLLISCFFIIQIIEMNYLKLLLNGTY